MKKFKYLMIVLLSIFLVVGCTKEEQETNEFQKLFKVNTTKVKSISYEEFLNMDKFSGVVFIADENEDNKEIAQIFCDALCECDIDKALFLKKSNIIDDQYKEIFDDELGDLLIVAFKKGNVIGSYSKDTKTDDVKAYLSNLIYEANPPICNDVC